MKVVYVFGVYECVYYYCVFFNRHTTSFVTNPPSIYIVHISRPLGWWSVLSLVNTVIPTYTHLHCILGFDRMSVCASTKSARCHNSGNGVCSDITFGICETMYSYVHIISLCMCEVCLCVLNAIWLCGPYHKYIYIYIYYLLITFAVVQSWWGFRARISKSPRLHKAATKPPNQHSTTVAITHSAISPISSVSAISRCCFFFVLF